MFLSLILYYIIIGGVIVSSGKRSSNYSVCHTSTCYKFEQRLRNAMNKKIDPCIDFYEYGCGQWAKSNHIPSYETTWSTNHKVLMKTRIRIEGILQRPKNHEEMPFINMAKQYYHSCMDEDAIESQGITPLQEFLDKTGGWPLTMTKGQWDKRKYTWQSIHDTHNRMFFNNHLFNIGFTHNGLSPNRENILTLSQISLTPNVQSKSNKLNRMPHYVSDYEGSAIRVALALMEYKKYNISLIELHTKVKKFISFENQLENILINNKKQEVTIMSIAEIQEYYDRQKTNSPTAKIDWLSTFQNFFKDVNVSIDTSEPVIVHKKPFLHELARLLDKTSPEVIVNYIQWNVIKQLLDELNEKMRAIAYKLESPDFYDMVEPFPRWIKCVDYTGLRNVISYLFVKKYSSKYTIDAVKEMYDDIITEMKKYILKSKLISNKTKEFMIDKANHILVHIGYPEWYNNRTEFFERYKGLEVGENYFQNLLNYMEYKGKYFASEFRQPFDRNKWLEYPITVNALYGALSNLIVLPAAEIQDPYFSPGIPLAINYGAIGFVIAHELAHAFDSYGILFDKFGKFRVPDEPSHENYTERMTCFVNQYDNFSSTDDGYSDEITGETTVNENIADSIAVEIAFAAFQSRKEKVRRQTRLPYMEYTNDKKLFYLSLANAWCGTVSWLLDSAQRDEHSPAKYRIIGSLTNSESFSKTFSCPISSPMNPASKCKLMK